MRRARHGVPVREALAAAGLGAHGDRWFATEDPFSFDTEHLAYHPTARRLEHGTPPAPVFFLAQGGMDIVSEVGVEQDPRGRAS